jgi:cellulose synthase/poly-beta-1,6-N-acetylglucosamine synthase-like glycosyltransferase
MRTIALFAAIALSSLALTEPATRVHPAPAGLVHADAAAPLDPTPARPRLEVDVREPVQKGRRIPVPAGGDLQAALDEARPGDSIVLTAGATYAGPFRLPAKDGDGWILVTSPAGLGADRSAGARSAKAALPAAGERIEPSHFAALPKLVAHRGSVIKADSGAHHYRFTGVEVAPAEGRFLYELVQLGDNESDPNQTPHHIVFDRCYIHGDRRAGGRRGIAMNSRDTAVINSYLSDFKEAGADSQAIAGWNGPGPFRIANNYLEAAGENVMFGGADPTIRDLVPADIVVTLNHMAKSLRWKKDHPSFEGTAWTVKNLFELKNARRVLVDRNLLEYNWVDAQNGFAILFTVRNQDGHAPWSVVEDVTFSGNLVRHVGAGINVLGQDDIHRSGPARRIAIRNNLFEDVGGAWGSGRLFQLLDGARDVTIDRNTASQSGSMLSGGDHAPHPGFVFTGNVAPHNEYGIIGSGTGTGMPTLERYFPDAIVRHNVIIGGDAAKYPPGNQFPPTPDGAGRFSATAGADVKAITATARRIASSSQAAAASPQPHEDHPMAAAVFAAALILLFYVYVGYPLVAWLRARLRPRVRLTADIEPTISIVLVAYNEADRIQRRIENLLDLDYPRERIEILIGSDGSTDETVRLARGYRDRAVSVHAFAERRGKPAVVNDLAGCARGDILVFADARQRFDREALRALVAPFADPTVGAVSGELVMSAPAAGTAVGRGAGFYWRYEKFIRIHESRSGSTVGATGAIYAIRRSLFEPIPVDTILDDVLIPLTILRKGCAVLFERAAKAYDEASATARQEHIRKVRTIAGNFQLLARERWLLNPRRNPLWLATMSHKVLRLALPVLHVALFWANLLLTGDVIYDVLMAGQLTFYCAAISGHVFRHARRRPIVLAVPYAMCLMIGATVAGFIRFVMHRQAVTWERVIPATSPRG